MNDAVKSNRPDGNPPPDMSKRQLITRGGIAGGGLAAFAAGYGETLFKAGKGLVTGSAGTAPPSALRGNSLTPEFRIDPATGVLTTQPGQTVAMSSCLGCWTQCGVRVRVDNESNRILRVAGNPYHPLATGNPAPMEMPVREVYARLGGDTGLEGRATSCARGSSMLEQQFNPHRVLQPLKRVGPRGAGQWKTISFEDLVKEVCEGGDLFGEGHVDGMRAVFDTQTLIDVDNPDYGPRSNQFFFTDASNEGRTALIRRFTEQSFGSINFANHGSYCGQSFRVGAGAALGDIKGMPHGKPDWTSAEFGLFIGTAPAQAGNPFQRQGRELAEARSRKVNPFRYVVVSPILPTSSSLAAGSGNRWQPIKPATDLALAMGMIRWIIENERYNAAALTQPGPAAVEAAGEGAWTNATHLMVADPKHPRFGTFLRGEDLGWPKPEAPAKPAAAAPAAPAAAKPAVAAAAAADPGKPAAAAAAPAPAPAPEVPDVYVVQTANGSLVAHTQPQPAQLKVDTTLDIPAWGENGQAVPVVSAFVMLSREAARQSLDEYAALCGVPRADIEALAREFTSHGKRAVADAHGGTMSGAGFQTAYAISMLNTLIGNLNHKGGLVLDAGPFGPFGPGPRYNFAEFPGKAKPSGLSLSRNRTPYEKSSEFKRKKASGANPYPAQAPWYPATGNLSSEMVASALNGYPYKAKVWFNHMANPVYAISGFRNALIDKLKDPQHLPLIVSINPFINETNAYADYIVPDTVTYESWGISVPWADVVAKSSTVRCPVVEPRVAKNARGEPINLEAFLFAVARTLKMPGFGAGAVKDKEGNAFDLDSATDFYLCGVANIAFSAGKPVGEASDDDLQVTGLKRLQPLLEAKLKPAEWRQVAMVLTRGGRFDKLEQAWEGDHLKVRHSKMLPLWDEGISKMRHSMTGERFSGCPTWQPTRLADGTPMRDKYGEKDWPMLMISYKSNLMSSMSIGASRLRQVHPHNPVSIHRDDAKRLGIANGQAIRIVGPGGAVKGVAIVREGIMPGAIAVEYGYGHHELGTREHLVDGHPMPSNEALGAGTNMNDMGLVDETRKGHANAWIDTISGAAVRQGVPVRVEAA
ncbi:molybdopterin dinucleotide binding domain-containing protein [Ottowia flava]|uniref:Molybdopterin dinucleotide binding domain-containing protein n=1 Tax=Ottowia flava TaxID=2675430 RepID=A0ABW4KV81_9BURK|nr:molybdopterin dinucleotide binding domain-containing protein [Ottowia sp. GY511]